MEYFEDMAKFMKQARIEVERVKKERGLKFPTSEENIIHYSTIPWADFTSINHARRLDIGRSIPKITFGKITRDRDQMFLPVDVHANHAVMDGFHVGKFINRFQELLNQ
jgi:chloramphenicol O-acetyltransferase type A